MIAPEPEARSNPQTPLLVLLRNNLLAALFLFVGLQIWRPCFFLTDDNLDGGLPFFVEVGHHLLNGQSPFQSAYLFGGNYDLQRDSTFFAWHPIYLTASLLAGTPFYYTIIDVCAFVLLMLNVAGFVSLAWYLRKLSETSWSDGWLMFFTLSFNFSVMALATGASWLYYMANNGALPWLALGLLQKDRRLGFGLIALFSVHQILGGHPLASISNGLFLSLFAVGMSVLRKSWSPLLVWAAGNLVALLITLPLLLPMFHGFAETQRSMGVTAVEMEDGRIETGLLGVSVMAGMAMWMLFPGFHPTEWTYRNALCSCAAAWLIFPALLSRAKWSGLQKVIFGLLILSAVMIIRPHWVSELMVRLPVIRSMRWPFRELVQFLFFFHFLLLLRPSFFRPFAQRLLATGSAVAMVVPMVLYAFPPTFNAMPLGRQMIFSGEFEQYWAQVRSLLKPSDRVAVLIPFDLYENAPERPGGVIGTFNYAMLARFTNASGYSHTAPVSQLYTKTIPRFPDGSYDIEQKADLLAERPELKFITLESMRPLRVTLSSGNGPTIDLTPYIPARFREAK